MTLHWVRALIAMITIVAASCATPAIAQQPRNQFDLTAPAAIESALIAADRTGYFGHCPSVDDTGHHPHSIMALEAVIAMTDSLHCSWPIESATPADPTRVYLRLERLDIFGDEESFPLLLIHDGQAWSVES